MIKSVFKSLLTFSIIGLGIINFSNGAGNGLEWSGFIYDGDCYTSNGSDICIDNHFNITNSEGYNFGKFNIGGWGDRYIFWKNGQLYYYQSYKDNFQGFISGYAITDDIFNIPNFTNPISNFYAGQLGNNFTKTYLNYYNNNVYFIFCPYRSDTNDYVCFGKKSEYLSGTLGYNFQGLTYAEINALVNPERSPLNGGGGGGGIIINGGSNASNNGSFINVECNNGNIKRFYEEAGYSKYLCYGGESYWSAGNYSTQMLIPGTGYSIFDIYNYMSGAIGTGDTYSTGNSIDVWFQYWRSQYGWWTNQYVSTENPFVGNPRILFGLFNFISRYGPTYQDKYVLDYCNLLINSDLSADYDGPNAKIFHCNSDGIVDFTNVDGTGGNSNNVGGLTSSWSGTFLGVGSGSLGSGQVYSFSSFITNFFDIISKVFNGFVGFETRIGFLPRYIVVPMLFLVLFRFLSH